MPRAVEVSDPEKVAYLTQTTLSVDDAARIVERLKRRFPAIVGPARDDICYATQNRQEAVRRLTPEADMVLVVGSRNSSNSQRLAELARGSGVAARLIDGPADIDLSWFSGEETVVLTAGASASGGPGRAVRGSLAATLWRAGRDARRVRGTRAFALPKM